jgi:hypothetical protein
MRRLILAAFLLLLIVFSSDGCRRRRKGAAADDGQIQSMLNVREPRAALQLIRGFHSVEADAWRWAEHQFSVVLKPPAGSAQKGAKLEVKISVPDVLLNKLGPLTLSAKVNGVPLDPQTFSQPGDFTYTRDVPPSALGGEAVTAEFTVDKFIPPTGEDQRELALIVFSIGLIGK